MFGEHALVHRCHRHKERNVCDLLPERDRPAILARIRGAWALENPELIVGYRDLAKLVIAIERHAAQFALPSPTTVTHPSVSETVTV